MQRVKKSIYSILRGSFLTDESAFKNWRIILFVILLFHIMITSAHRADEKVMKIAVLNKEKRELRAEDIDTGTLLMRMQMESSIRKRVREKGLFFATTPPQKIKVTLKIK